MQDLEHDMDELFRKAAENYPLKLPTDQWDAIVPWIRAQASEPVKVNRNYSQRSGWLFLPFAVSGVFLLYLLHNEPRMHTGATDTKVEVEQTPFIQDNNRSLKNAFKVDDENKKALASNQAVFTSESNDFVDASNETATSKEKITVDYSTEQMKYANVLKVIRVNGEMKERGNVIDRKNVRDIPGIISPAEEKSPVIINPPRRGFYYGVVAGPAFNTIKDQGVTKTGYSVGLLGGYQFCERWSLETGIIYSKKFYKTDAKYFSMDKIGPAMPQGMHVMKVDGCSEFVEWPLHVRYDVIQKTSKSLFVTTGLSTYMITHESNGYHTLLNGVEKMMYGNYETDAVYFSAAIDLSIGYQQRIGNRNHIRVEPYIQIPVKGIGMGDLPVTAAGVHFGITRGRR
jgi:hypothetical protein